MPDHISDFLWLPLGGLIAVLMLAIVFTRKHLRHNQSPRHAAAKKVAVLSAVKPLPMREHSSQKAEDLAAILRAELAAFQAAYRADLKQFRADMRAQDQPLRMVMTHDAHDRLEQAIDLARTGQDAAAISTACDLNLSDAAALVRYHGPHRAAAGSSQH